MPYVIEREREIGRESEIGREGDRERDIINFRCVAIAFIVIDAILCE